MDADTTQHLLVALRDCGLYTPDQIAAAQKVLTAGGTSAQIADELFSLGLLTQYQQRKVRGGRTSDVLFGPYFVLDKIGEGGMGKVYRAAQQRVGRVVALKLVRQTLLTNKMVINRYRREARAAAALHHPNIVSLYDADDISGRYYLAMEYVDGIDLARMVREFGNPPTSGLPLYQEACEYVRQAALGLQHAHDSGFVHRDIKPSNILVEGDRALPGTDGKATVKILDMGLIRSIIESEEASQTDLTRDGTVVGTPDYMAPEQAKNSSTVDARADLYSLGCTLFYLLKGQAPFPNGSPIDKLLQHQLDAPPDLRKYRPDVPLGVIEIVDRLMKKNKEERYASATAVAEALGPFVPGGAPSSNTPTPGYEPFCLTDDPDAIATDPVLATSSSPGAGNRVTVVAAEAAEGDIADATIVSAETLPTAPKTGLVSVRVLSGRPANGEVVFARTAAAATATTVPKPDMQPSSDNLTGGGTPTSMRTIRGGSSGGYTSPRRRGRKPPRRSGPPVALIVGAVVLGLAVLVGATALFIRGPRKETAPTATSASHPAEEVKTHGGDRVAADSELLPLVELLPDKTTGFVVLRPQPFWKKAVYEPSDNGLHASAAAFTARTKLDLQKCERATIAFLGAPGTYVLTGEGRAVSTAGAADLEAVKHQIRETPGDNGKGFGSFGPRFGVVLGPHEYAVGTSKDGLTSLANQVANHLTPGKTVSSELRGALSLADSGADTPLVLFAAGGSWQLPDGTKLSSIGVRGLIATLRIHSDDEFAFEVILTGTRAARLKDFVNVTLATDLTAKHPGLKPFAIALTRDDPVEEPKGGEVELHYRGRISWTAFRAGLDGILPSPPKK
ncbi:serine/threonine-protein kinase [Fimbriiglobus ruber]|nr:serine/threonine-protein kinase [Fimbriiglobus ruber]